MGAVRVGDSPSLETEEGLVLPLPKIAGLELGRKITFEFRPEHIGIDPIGIAVEVIIVEPTGSETQVSAWAGGLTITAIFRDRVDLKSDQKLSLLPDPRRGHVFDTAAGVCGLELANEGNHQ
jgi:multiple sugar transport system ATP-binding protein